MYTAEESRRLQSELNYKRQLLEFKDKEILGLQKELAKYKEAVDFARTGISKYSEEEWNKLLRRLGI